MKKNVVISLGGSVICPDKIDIDFIRKFSNFISSIKKAYNIYIVCGGGRVARNYISASESLGAKGFVPHKIGIRATWLNAALMSAALNAKEMDSASPGKIASTEGVVVSGGYKVGWTSDTDAAIIAVHAKCPMVINITDVPGVYNKNPKEHKDAKFLPALTWPEFFKINKDNLKKAGGHFVFDPYAARICSKNKISVAVVGPDIKTLKDLLDNRPFYGSIIG